MVHFSNILKYGAVYRVCFLANCFEVLNKQTRYLVFEDSYLTLPNFVCIVIYHPKNAEMVI